MQLRSFNLKKYSLLKIFMTSIFLATQLGFDAPLLMASNVKLNIDKAKIKSKGATENQVIMAVDDNGKLKTQWADLPNLADNAVTENKIADNAVTSNKLAGEAVSNSKIQGGAINEEKLANNAVTENKIISGAVSSTKIAAGAIDASKIADGVLPSTFVVDDSGNADYTTIQSAIDNLPASGGKIYIREGSYSSFNVTDDNILIEGSGLSTSISGIINIQNCQNFSIQNLMVENSASVIQIQNSDNIKILNCTITGMGIGYSGIVVSSSQNILAKNNTIFGSSYYAGIYIGSTSSKTFINNNHIIAETTGGGGITVDDDSTFTKIDNNLIEVSNTSAGNAGIYLGAASITANATYTTVSNNTIIGGEMGIQSQHSYTTITGNIIKDTATNSIGIGASSGTGSITIRNSITGNITSQEINLLNSTINGDNTIFSNIANGIGGDSNTSQPMQDNSGGPGDGIQFNNQNEMNMIF